MIKASLSKMKEFSNQISRVTDSCLKYGSDPHSYNTT